MAELKNTLGNDVKALQAKLDKQLVAQVKYIVCSCVYVHYIIVGKCARVLYRANILLTIAGFVQIIWCHPTNSFRP